MGSWLRRLGGFGLLPALALLSPLLVLPLLTRAAGAEGWAAIAIGQAVGLTGAALVQFGWSTIGPSLVAGEGWDEARGIYFASLLMRGGLFVVCAPAAAAITALIVPSGWLLPAALAGTGTCLSGLSAAWFFVGRGTPGPLLRLETLPRLLGTLTSAALLAAGLGVTAYVLVTITTEVLIVANGAARLGRRTRPFRTHLEQVRFYTRTQGALALSGLLSLGYTRASVPIVAAANFAIAPPFAAADRIQSYGRIALIPLVQAFQSWVYQSAAEPTVFIPRARRAAIAVAGGGPATALALALFLPALSVFLFGPELELSGLQATLVAAAIACIGISLSTSSFFLVPLAETGKIAASQAAASILGLPGIWLASLFSGVEGPLAVIVAVEFAVAVYQVVATRRLLRTLRSVAEPHQEDFEPR